MKTLERKEEKTQPQAREKFTAKDLLKQVVIAAIAVAPDGSSVVYVKRTVENGKYVRNLWRTDFEGRDSEQLTSAKANDGRPRFSPDGRKIVFISDRTGKPQAWVISTRGGEPVQITDLAGGVGMADWSPDGSKLLLVGGSGEERFLIGDKADPVGRKIRDYTWRLDGAGVRDEYTSVWVTEVEEPKPKRITPPDYGVDAAAWSPDGQRIAFLADRSESRGLEEIDSVWTMDAEGGEPARFAHLKGGVLALTWAPGKEIAYLGVDHEGSPGWADVELHVGGRRIAADRNLNIQVTSYGDYQDQEQMGPVPPIWEDDEHLIALVSHHGYSHPYRFGLDGSVEALAAPDATCSSLAAGGGRIVVVAATSEGPNDVYAVEDGKLRRLTDDGGSWYGPFARKVEHVQIKHRDGHSIDTWLIPAGGDATKKAPLVIDVHGGPNSSFGPTPWLEMNALADAGIHVVYCNPRGSVSYGEKYARDLEGVWGDPDGSDLLRVIEWAVDEKHIATRDTIGIMGLSYGGFMTNWMLATHPGVFAAACSENPVTDLLGEWATSDFGRYIGRRSIETQNPWEDIDKFVKRSPFYNMHRNKAPLLLLHAENDMRCPPGNSDMVFHILRTVGTEVEMIRYPQESHIMLAIGRPDRRVDRIERIVDWFTKHLGSAS
jgi:dipeptidyl aminopeptidase/acylaminoacyl peptidase